MRSVCVLQFLLDEMNSTSVRTRLFSDDGIGSNYSRFEPHAVYGPDESTTNEISFLFTTLKSTEHSDSNANEISIRGIPFSYDLSMLASEGNGDRLTFEDVTNGMSRIATHFISTHELIQSRANAYVRCKLAGAESILNGLVESQSIESVERDQILLSSMTVPPSPREQAVYNSDDPDPGQLSRSPSVERIQRNVGPRIVSTPPPGGPSLFRSPSVGREHMKSYPTSVFSMDDETRAASLGFLPSIFDGSTFASRKGLPPGDVERMQELWEFFDFDDDGVITRDDVLQGVTNIAKNFLATDSFTQMLAHAYVQRKIRRAVLAIRKHHQSSASHLPGQARKRPVEGHSSNSAASLSIPLHEAVKFKPGMVLVYTDEEGNNHITKVIRLSNRPTNGGDAYYIETKGVRLYVPVGRLRQLTAQEQAALERRDLPFTHQHYNSHAQQNGQQTGKHKNGVLLSPHAGTNPHSYRGGSENQRNGSEAEHDDNRSGRRSVPDLALGTSEGPAQGPQGEEKDTQRLHTRTSSPRHQPQTPSKVAPSTPTHAVSHNGEPPSTPTHSNPHNNIHSGSSGKGGILGYLKSGMGILGIGGPKQSTVVPHAVSEPNLSAHQVEQLNSERPRSTLSSNLTTNDVLSLDGGMETNDGDSVFTNGSLFCAPTGQLQVADPGQEAMSTSPSSDQLHLTNVPSTGALSGDCGPNTHSTVLMSPFTPHDAAASFPASTSDAGSTAGGMAGSTSVTDLSASQRLRSTAALLKSDAEVLAAVAKTTSGAFKLTRAMIPKPKKIEPYPIYFNRGKNGFFEFNQVDFGIQFTPFMKDIATLQDPRWQAHHDSLTETNRCFFLHFGVAMGLHPFALQHCFRCAAAELLKYPENEMTIFFGEALESLLLRNDFVDAQVLSAIWPLEFDRYRILIVRVDHNGRIESFTSFRSELGPVDAQGEWAGEELIFTLQWNHFTILKPKSEQLSKPITAVLAAATMIGIMPLEFITKVDPDPAKRFRIC